MLEALGICINVCGALSLLSSLLVGLTIVYYGLAKRRVALKAVGNIAFATTGCVRSGLHAVFPLFSRLFLKTCTMSLCRLRAPCASPSLFSTLCTVFSDLFSLTFFHVDPPPVASYSLFWLLPRQRRNNLAALDFGGFPGECGPGESKFFLSLSLSSSSSSLPSLCTRIFHFLPSRIHQTLPVFLHVLTHLPIPKAHASFLDSFLPPRHNM
jgi:hypothetical protein